MMMNKPLAIAYKPFKTMKMNTSKERSFYTQGQRFAARVLCIVWLLASGSPEGALAIPKRQPTMVPAPTTSPGNPALASTPPTPLPGGALELASDSLGSFWGYSAGSSPSIDAALQERMSQEAVSDKGSELLRTFPKVTSVEENLSFQAREGESVRFSCQMGQWRAEVSSHIGAFSRQSVLPVVCSQGEDVASNLEALSRYPSWYSQRQIHVLDRNVCPTLGEVVYVGELGLKGGGDGEASGSGEQRDATGPATQVLASFHPLFIQERNGLLLQGTPKQPAEQSQTNRKRKASRDLSLHPEAPSPQRASGRNPGDTGQSSTASVRPSTPPEQSREIATHPASESLIALAAKQDENCEVRRAAIEILVSQAQDAPNKAPAIISQLTEIAQDAHSDVRKEALKALGSVAAAVPGEAPNITPTLTEVAKNTSQLWNVRQAAIEALGVVASAASSEAPKIIPALLEFSSDKDKSVQAAAIKALKSVDPDIATQESPKIVPVLLRVANNEDTDAYVRAVAIKALESVTPVAPQKAPEIIRTMIAAAKDKDKNVRLAAIESLESVSRAATKDILNHEIIPTLIATAENSARLAAIKALKSVYRTATQDVLNHEIIPTLIASAKDSVRLAAIDAFKSVTHLTPEEATEVIHTMIEAARDENEDVQKAALKTLGAVASIAPSAALATIPELIEKAKYQPRYILPLAAVRELFAKAAPNAPSEAENRIPQLIAYAKNKDRKVCEAAINTLGAATPTMLSKHPEIIQSLIEATEHKDQRIRRAAIEALGAVAPVATQEVLNHEIIPTLIRVAQQQSKRWHDRSAAIKALGQLASKASSEDVQNIIQILKDAAKDRDSNVQKDAIEALAQVASALPQDTLGIIPALLEATKDKNQHARQIAIQELVAVASTLPQKASGTIPTLIEVIQDESQLWRVRKVIIQGQEKSVRAAATEALGKVAPAAPGKASNITQHLLIVAQDLEWSVKAAATEALGRVALAAPGEASNIIQHLLIATKDQNENVRAAATEALRKVATAPGEASNIIQHLLIAAQDPNKSIRVAAIKALGEMDLSALQKVPNIIQHLLIAAKDQEGSARAAAIKALGKMNPDTLPEATSIIPTLIETAKKAKAYDRQAAIQALAKIASAVPSKATEIILALIAAAQDQEQNVRAAAIEAFGKIAPTVPGEAPNIIPILIAAVQDQDEGVREAATRALAEISIQQLLACYWTGPDPSLIPYITIRLLAIPIPTDNPPLQVWKSDTPQDLQVVLSATAGQRDVWTQPQEVVQCFTRRIRDEASQIEKGLEGYKRYLEMGQARCDLPGPIQAELGLPYYEKYLAMIPTRDPGIPPNVAWVLCSVRHIHKCAGRLKRAMQECELALPIRQGLYGDNPSRVIGSLGSVGTDIARVAPVKYYQQERFHQGPSLCTEEPTTPPKDTDSLTSTVKEIGTTRAALIKYYQQERFHQVPSFFPETPATPIEDTQHHLTLCEQIKTKGKPQEEQGNKVVPIHERLIWAKKSIAPQDLFKPRSIKPGESEKEIHKVLLVGEAGSGKTTLSHKLVHDWARGAWGADFTAVYLLPVRNLQQSKYNGATPQTTLTLDMAIVRECFPAKLQKRNEDFKRLQTHVQKELQKPTTLVILDSLDERDASEEILRQAQAGSHKLLILSRSYGIAAERQMADITIEHQGLNDAQIDAYVQRYFQQRGETEAHSDELLSFIKKYQAPAAISHVPVNLEILCALWRTDQQGVRVATMQGSLPDLYRRLTRYIWERYQEEYPTAGVAKQATVFQHLGALALDTLKEGAVQLNNWQVKDVLEESPITVSMLKDSGFLQAAGREQCQFPHLTFQEYFAGRRLAGQLFSNDPLEQEHAKTFLARYKYAPQYGRTLSFMAGEVNRSKKVEGLKVLLRQIAREQEIVGVQHLLLQLRLLHEWLCIARSEVEEDMAMLEDEFQVMASQAQWFQKGFEHIRNQEYSTGCKLLELLTSSLKTLPAIASHTPALFQLLEDATKDGDERVRAAALQALSALIQVAPAQTLASFPSIQKALKDGSGRVRAAALQALSALIQVAPAQTLASFPSIQKALKDGSGRVRAAALQALPVLIQAAPAQPQELLKSIHESIRDSLNNGDWRIREGALQALPAIIQADPSRDGEALSSIQKALKDDDWWVRSAALASLSALIQAEPERAQKFLTSIQKALKDDAGTARSAVLRVLSALIRAVPDRAQKFFPSIQKALEDKDWLIRSAALAALPAMIQAAPEHSNEAFASIKKALDEDKSWRVREAALRAISALIQATPTQAQKLFPSLQKALRDSSVWVRCAALQTLGFFKTLNLASLTLSNQAVRDESKDVRIAAFEVLEQVDEAATLESSSIIEILKEAAQDQNEDIKEAAIKALGKVAKVALDEAQDIIEILKEAVAQGEDVDVRQAALEALGKVAQVAPDEAQAIIEILKKVVAQGEDADVQQTTLEALGKVAQVAPDEAQAIIEILKKASAQEGNEDVRQAAIEVFGQIAEAAPGEAVAIIEILKEVVVQDEDADTRRVAIEALEKVAQAVPSAGPGIIPSLIEAAKDQESLIQDTTTRALEKISLQQLLQSYWASQDPRLIPYITARLYHTPLLVESPRQERQQVILYLTEERLEKWRQPQPVVQRFMDFVKAEAGQAEKGLKYNTQYLARIQALSLGDHPDVARALNNVGEAYAHLGNYSNALQYTKDGLAMHKRLSPSHDHPDVAHSLSAVGELLTHLDRHQESLQYTQGSLAMHKRLCKDHDHPDVAHSLNSVGASLENLDRLPEALAHKQKALEIRQRLAKHQDHPDIAHTLNSIGDTLIKLNKAEAGMQYYERALAMCRRLFKDQDHPHIAQSLHGLGIAWEALGFYAEAANHHKQAVKVALRAFQRLHPQLTKYRGHLVGTLPKLKETKVQQIKEEIQQLCIQVLGAEHASELLAWGEAS